MNEVLDTLILPLVVAAIAAVPTTTWYTAQRWFVRKGIDLVVSMAVSKVAVEKVHPLKLENSESPDIRRYDLLPDQAKLVMQVAKEEAVKIAQQHDQKKAWYQPSIAPKITRDLSKLEPTIERVVQERKHRRPNRILGKGF